MIGASTRAVLFGTALAVFAPLPASAQSTPAVRVQALLESAAEYYGAGDYSNAWFRFWALALDGNPVAQFNLGQLYRQGFGIPTDLQLARYWYGEAAAQGHPFAQYNLGIMYELGHGTRQDLVEARAWYRRAAAADVEVARSALLRLDRGASGPAARPNLTLAPNSAGPLPAPTSR